MRVVVSRVSNDLITDISMKFKVKESRVMVSRIPDDPML
jgi:hypothetical protein